MVETGLGNAPHSDTTRLAAKPRPRSLAKPCNQDRDCYKIRRTRDLAYLSVLAKQDLAYQPVA